jgi:hypothetical protein
MKKEMTRGGKSVVFILHGSGERGAVHAPSWIRRVLNLGE